MLSYWLLPSCLPCFLKCASPHTTFPVHDILPVAQLNKRRISWKKSTSAKWAYCFFPSNRFRKQTTRLTDLFAIANVTSLHHREKVRKYTDLQSLPMYTISEHRDFSKLLLDYKHTIDIHINHHFYSLQNLRNTTNTGHPITKRVWYIRHYTVCYNFVKTQVHKTRHLQQTGESSTDQSSLWPVIHTHNHTQTHSLWYMLS